VPFLSDLFRVYATINKKRLKFVAVAEPIQKRRENFANLHNIPPNRCYERWEDYKMADKRKYTEILRDLDAKMAEYIITVQYINNHLGNIDQHLEKINTTNLDQEVKIIRNKDRISIGYKIGGGLLVVLGGGLIAFLLTMLGVIEYGG